jgi:hypothetical protein
MGRDCVTEEVLADYLENRLNERKKVRIEGHLAGCETCLEALTIAGQMLRGSDLGDMDPVPEGVTARAVKAVKALQQNSRSGRIARYGNLLVSEWRRRRNAFWPGKFAGLAPVRGSKMVLSEDLILLKKSFSDLDVEIELEKKDPDKASITVRLVCDKAQDKPVRVTLLKNEREVSSYLLSEAAAVFEDISFGPYMLVFSRNGARVGEYPFEIRETRHDRR